MVSTRHHPRQFPEPILPPSRTSTPSKAQSSPKSTSSPPTSPTTSSPPSKSLTKTPTPKPRAPRKSASPLSLAGYTHTPHLVLLGWLGFSLPLVLWDMAYVALRPHSMPGGKWHSLWTPYALYGTVDYVYGWPAWNNKVGFTAAQSSLNFVETVMYVWYLVVVGKQLVSYDWEGVKGLQDGIRGPGVGLATLACFSTAVMTLSKTVLYWMNEYFSGFENIGHNSPLNLVLLWIVPNGLWLVMPSFMVYVLGKEILEAMDAGASGKKTS